MKTFLATALATVAFADVLSIPATVTDEAKANCKKEAEGGLSAADAGQYEKYNLKIANNFKPSATEQAAKDKVDAAAATCETKFANDNAKKTTAEEGDQIAAKALSLLTPEQQTAKASFDTKTAANEDVTTDETAANAEFAKKQQEQLDLWGAGTFEPLASDAAIAVGAAGALLAAVALF